ncbi:MAG: DedA family protein [Planctomycetota bacterium]
MNWIAKLTDLFLHLDKHLGEITSDYGVWTYLILFVIVFCETGLVVMPFLPGDSLLFAAGAIAALGSLNLFWLLLLLMAAAIIGDTVNYWIGHYLGPRVFHEQVRFLKREHLERTQRFYDKHGGKTIVLARFIPIIRTFAPFVAGIGKMTYWRFITFNVAGGVAWVAMFGLGGYYFGNFPVIKRNFSLVIVAIIVISFIPVVIEYFRARSATSRNPQM